MKELYFLTIALLGLYSSGAIAAEINLAGNFYGKNLYIRNYVKDPGQFCTVTVTVNSVKLGNQINSSAYEINFGQLGVGWGEKVNIKIEYKEGCKPEVINPEVLKPVPSATFVSAKANKNGINWTTLGESGPFNFQVQQYKWDRWVTIGEIMGKGTIDTAQYTFEVKHLNGPNVYRIYQFDPISGKSIVSDDLKIRSSNPVITFSMEKGDVIKFSDVTQYEIYNADGELVEKGEGAEVDASPLPKGEYYIGYGNSSETFKK